MLNWFSMLFVLIILCNLVLLGSSRLVFCIRTVAVQGVVLGLIPLAGLHALETRHLLLALFAIILKGVVFPWLLLRALKLARVKREVEPFVGFNLSLAFGFLALSLAFILVSRLSLPATAHSAGIMTLAIFTILTGLFLLITRRKALSMVLGYLVLENGIYAIGTILAVHIPLMVELGLLLDVWVAVFGMGIATYHINREFDQTDVDQLIQLRG